MPRPKFEQESLSRRQLPEVLEQELRETDQKRVAGMLAEALNLKDVLDADVDDAHYDPRIHLARRYRELKEELGLLQAMEEVDGFRHGNIVFQARLQAGRTTVPMKAFEQALLERGVRAEVLEQSRAAAEKTGEDFWVREVAVLDE